MTITRIPFTILARRIALPDSSRIRPYVSARSFNPRPLSTLPTPSTSHSNASSTSTPSNHNTTASETSSSSRLSDVDEEPGPMNPEDYARRQAESGQPNPFFDQDDFNESTQEAPFRDEDEDPKLTALKQRILAASLPHVATYGWSVETLQAGCASELISTASHGLFKNGPVELVWYVADLGTAKMNQLCNDPSFQLLTTEEKLFTAMKTRLEFLSQYNDIWPQALALCSQPQYLLQSTCKLTDFINQICHLSGDDATNLDWYSKRTLLTGVYVSTELFLLTDRSPGFNSTWTFLQRRLRDSRTIAGMPSQVHTGIQYAANIGAIVFEKLLKRA